MYHRHPRRWSTRFGRWLDGYGVRRLVDDLSRSPRTAVTPTAVYCWLRGHAPSPDRAAAIVRLSRGALSMDVIYGHRDELAELQRRRGR